LEVLFEYEHPKSNGRMDDLLREFWLMSVLSRPSNLRNLLIAVVLALGLIQVWENRFAMSFDGISYLDMGDAYLRGDWQTAINGYWNPLYSWILGLGLRALHPSPYWEFPAVQLLNFLIFVVTTAAFEYLLKGLLPNRGATGIRIVAYALFLWSSWLMIRVWMVSPDMLIAASVYVAFGLLLRAPAKLTTPLLAISLAAGYFAKPILFPVALMVLLVGWTVLPWRKAFLSTAIFLLLASPLILALSRRTGHVTIGDTGRLNYSWYVNGVVSRFWLGGPDEAGKPEHPPRVVIESPRVYEYGGVFPVTFPIWYDSSYWYRGLKVWIDPRKLLHALLHNGKGVVRFLLFQGGGFLVGGGLCYLLRKDRSVHLQLNCAWKLWAVSVATLVLYCAIHVEPRHLAPFALVIFLIPFVTIGIPKTWIAAAVAGLGLCCAALFATIGTADSGGYQLWDRTPENVSWQVADGLQHIGLVAGGKVASVCQEGENNVRWARLLRVHIVAGTDWHLDFWRLSKMEQKQALAAMASSGAELAVADEAPEDPANASGWHQIGSTHYYVYALSQEQKAYRGSEPGTTASQGDTDGVKQF
jgi:hypothetical protein